MNTFAVKGDICYSVSPKEIAAVKDSYILIEDGKIIDIVNHCPDIPVHDYTGHIIIPGMVDLHMHAPQYHFYGLGMDMELLDWLNTRIFPEESKYSDSDYAEKIYSSFADTLKASVTTRAVIFSTIHANAAKILMEKMESSGLISYVGKVNMDRNSPEYLTEGTSEQSLKATELWLRESIGTYRKTKPILTPRFTPSCTDELMQGLGELREKYNLPVQSHLSENLSEIELVRKLCPDSKNYADTYDRFGLLNEKSIMAHCVHLSITEMELLQERGTFIAHCPQSNINLSSGIAPVRRFLDMGIKVGLATDLAGGMYISMFRAITDAIGVSKLRWSILGKEDLPLTFEEAFYMATMGGGSFFGHVGSFLPGYEADIIVLPDTTLKLFSHSLRERLENIIYLAGENIELTAKYAAGVKLL